MLWPCEPKKSKAKSAQWNAGEVESCRRTRNARGVRIHRAHFDAMNRIPELTLLSARGYWRRHTAMLFDKGIAQLSRR